MSFEVPPRDLSSNSEQPPVIPGSSLESLSDKAKEAQMRAKKLKMTLEGIRPRTSSGHTFLTEKGKGILREAEDLIHELRAHGLNEEADSLLLAREMSFPDN